MIDRTIREKIYRIKWVHRLLMFFAHNRGWLFCIFLAFINDYHGRLQRIKDERSKDRCFIIGNGPSLSVEDLELIKNEDCLASNGIFEIFDKTTWRPKYYFLIDRYAPYSPKVLEGLDVKYMFLGSYYYLHNKVLRKDAFCIREKTYFDNRKCRFSDDISKYFVNGMTVSYFAMQTAAFLGYKEIYLLGFDNTYKYEKQSDGSIIDTGVNAAHFYNDKDPRNVVGEPLEMEKSYMSFKDYAYNHKMIVKNVTRGGKLEIFERDILENIVG